VTIAWSVAQLALTTPDLDPDAHRLAGSIVSLEEAHTPRTVPTQRPGDTRWTALRRWFTRR
jgi:hypothetical protein